MHGILSIFYCLFCSVYPISFYRPLKWFFFIFDIIYHKIMMSCDQHGEVESHLSININLIEKVSMRTPTIHTKYTFVHLILHFSVFYWLTLEYIQHSRNSISIGTREEKEVERTKGTRQKYAQGCELLMCRVVLWVFRFKQAKSVML